MFAIMACGLIFGWADYFFCFPLRWYGFLVALKLVWLHRSLEVQEDIMQFYALELWYSTIQFYTSLSNIFSLHERFTL
jgi:hypothetical protein